MHSIENVVSQGMCVGCGACSVATGSRIPVTIGRRGAYQADLAGVSEADKGRGDKVCPFSDRSKSENAIAEQVFPAGMPQDDVLGTYSSVTAGRVVDDNYLTGSSSGGLTSWTANTLLSRGLVDGVIHVGGSEEPSEGLFTYRVSYSEEELVGQRKSVYYSTSFAEALSSIRGNGKRYAFIGVPCFVRAARLVCEEDERIGSQIKFFLGLVCGHLKSAWFAESLAWQTGVSPTELESVDFRVKSPDKAANDYDFGARARGTEELMTKPTRSLVGGNWGHGMFQLDACNYCDDIFAETADVVFGDAWLPEFQSDPRGTNVIVSRNSTIDRLLTEGRQSGEISFENIEPERASASQGGNIRHRRVGLAIRLQDDIDEGISTPVKRVKPGTDGIDSRRIAIVRYRRYMTKQSFIAFQNAKAKSDISVFVNSMKPLILRYRLIDRTNIASRVKSKLLTKVRRFSKS